MEVEVYVKFEVEVEVEVVEVVASVSVGSVVESVVPPVVASLVRESELSEEEPCEEPDELLVPPLVELSLPPPVESEPLDSPVVASLALSSSPPLSQPPTPRATDAARTTGIHAPSPGVTGGRVDLCSRGANPANDSASRVMRRRWRYSSKAHAARNLGSRSAGSGGRGTIFVASIAVSSALGLGVAKCSNTSRPRFMRPPRWRDAGGCRAGR